jgi:hypothetical protein
LLQVDPSDRWTLDGALKCDWMREDDDILSSRNLSWSLSALKDTRARLRWRAGISAVAATRKLRENIIK